MAMDEKLRRVKPSLDELLPDPEAREAFDETSAALEAGRLVRAFRRRRGLTQSELASRLAITQARISAIETGEGRDGPSYALLKRIAHACGVAWPVTPLAKHAMAHSASSHWKKATAGVSKTVKVVDTKGDVVGKVVGVSVGRIKAEGQPSMKFDPALGAFVIGRPSSVRKAATRISRPTAKR